MTKNEINSKEYSKKNFSLKRFKKFFKQKGILDTSTGNIPVLLPVESHKEITSSKLSRKLSKLCKKEDPCRYYTDLVNEFLHYLQGQINSTNGQSSDYKANLF